MIRSLARACQDFLDLPDDGSVEAILHPGSRSDEGFVSFFLYRGGRPLCIAKVPRGDDANTELEAASLRMAAHAVEGAPIVRTLDQVLETRHIAGRLVLFKEFRSGKPAAQAIASKRDALVLPVFRSVAAWWIDYVEASRSHHVFEAEAKREAVVSMLEPLGAIDMAAPWVQLFLSEGSAFLGPSHGDLVPANVLMRGTVVDTVIDFENFTMGGFPSADLVGWIISTATKLHGRGDGMLSNTVIGGSGFAREVALAVQAFTQRCDMPIEVFVDLLPLYSHRSLSIAARWGLEREADLHRRLLADFVAQRAAVLAAWTA
tara:strand:+ start:19363 stop:20316 length:954 start_codon:yes stop_codon:yes gene_type:complete